MDILIGIVFALGVYGTLAYLRHRDAKEASSRPSWARPIDDRYFSGLLALLKEEGDYLVRLDRVVAELKRIDVDRRGVASEHVHALVTDFANEGSDIIRSLDIEEEEAEARTDDPGFTVPQVSNYDPKEPNYDDGDDVLDPTEDSEEELPREFELPKGFGCERFKPNTFPRYTRSILRMLMAIGVRIRALQAESA